MAVVDTTLPAMGSHARLFLSGGPDDLELALRDRLTDLENRWSRFIDSSEVSVVNNSGGATVSVSTDTLLLFERALTASRMTRGWFDPGLLHQLEAAGYDRSLADVEGLHGGHLVATIDHSSPDKAISVHDWGATCRLIDVNRSAATVSMPPGVGFDPGGMGKGLAADLLLAQALDSGADAAMIDLGGDIVTGGHAPEYGWSVGIEDPFNLDTTVCTLRIPWGAVATSSRAKRRWLLDGETHHHLIDPGTGLSSTSDVVSATVVAGHCWLAEAFAKAALLAGTRVGLELLGAAGVEGLLIATDGGTHYTDAMAGFICEAGR